MAIPLAALALPALGAGLGALEGYKKGGGTGALLGAGVGAATPAALRLAGTALGGIPLLAAGAQKGVTAARTAMGLAGPVASGSQIIQGAVPAVGLALGAPGIAGGLAGQVLARPTQGAGQLGAGALGYNAPGVPGYGGAALPPGLGQYGPTTPYGSPLDVLGVPGMGQRLETLKTAQTQRDVLRTLLPEIERAAEARSKKELERQMAAAGIRQNIKTRAAMQQLAQEEGLKAGLGALQQAGGALTSQYQYQ